MNAAKPGIFKRIAEATAVLRGSPSEAAWQRFFGGGGEGMKTRPTRSYSSVGAVYTCVRPKADALVRMPMVISTEDDQVIETGPLVELVERPNPKMSGRAFWRMTSAHLDLFGRVHWHLTLDGAGRVVEVIPINPLQMRPVTDQAGELTGWRFTAAGPVSGRVEFLPVDEVHTILDPDFEDPSMPFDGLSPRGPWRRRSPSTTRRTSPTRPAWTTAWSRAGRCTPTKR